MFFKIGLDTLPFDIKQLVLFELESEKDLLHLSLTNKGWKDLIIPYHLEYRTLRLSRNQPHVWRHLAQKGHLASRIRRVTLESGFILEGEGWEERRTTGSRQDVYPRVREPGGPTPQSYECHEVRKAFANMRLLDTFLWEGPKRQTEDWFSDYPPIPGQLSRFIAQAIKGLSEANSVRTLCFWDKSSAVVGPESEEMKSIDFPLWNFRNLESLSLNIQIPDDSRELTLSTLLKNNLNSLTTLQLNLRYTPASVMDWTLPNLKALSLTMDLLDSLPQATPYPRRFLAVNPTIQDLDMHAPIHYGGPPPDGFLPILRTVCLRRRAKSSLGIILRSREGHEPLTNLSGVSLNDETLQIMMLQRKALAGLKFLSIDSVYHPCMLTRLGAILPSLETLQYRKQGCGLIVLDIDDYLSLISSFTSLRVIDGVAVRVTSLQKEHLVKRLSSAASSVELFAIVVSSATLNDAFFKVNLAQKVWEEIPSLEDFFHHDTVYGDQTGMISLHSSMHV